MAETGFEFWSLWLKSPSSSSRITLTSKQSHFRDISLSIPDSFYYKWGKQGQKREVICSRLLYTTVRNLEKDSFSGEEDGCLYKHNIPAIQIGSAYEHKKREWITLLPNPSKWPSIANEIGSLRPCPPEGRMCLSCQTSHIRFMDMKNHILELALVQIITQFLWACCVPFIGPLFNYEVMST